MSNPTHQTVWGMLAQTRMDHPHASRRRLREVLQEDDKSDTEEAPRRPPKKPKAKAKGKTKQG